MALVVETKKICLNLQSLAFAIMMILFERSLELNFFAEFWSAVQFFLCQDYALMLSKGFEFFLDRLKFGNDFIKLLKVQLTRYFGIGSV